MKAFTAYLKTLAAAEYRSADLQSTLLPAFRRISTNLNNHKYFPTWIWCISKLGFQVSSEGYQDLLINMINVIYESRELEPRDVTTSITGMAKLKFLIHDLPANAVSNILRVIEPVSMVVNAREVGNLLHSLCKMGVEWKDLSPKTRSGYLQSFSRHKAELLNQQGSMSIYSLGLMGCVFDELDSKSKDDVIEVMQGIFEEVKKDQFRAKIQHVRNNLCLLIIDDLQNISLD